MIPPYVPFKTLVTFLDGLKAAIPPVIDRSLMKSLSGGSQSELLVALRYLGFMDPGTNASTDTLRRFVQTEGTERRQVLKEILESSYSFLFDAGFEIENATARQLQERFEQTGATGDTLQKCIRFFLKASTVAGLSLSPHFKRIHESRSSAGRGRRKANAIQESQATPAQAINDEGVPAKLDPASPTFLDKLLEKLPGLPPFDPNWSKEAQEAWLNTYKELLGEFKKLPKNE
ncbi:MAG: DUF5343 domain-containing protein [Thermodesulfobacteriota bacterium]